MEFIFPTYCVFIIIWLQFSTYFVRCSINSNTFDHFTTCNYHLGNVTVQLSSKQVIISKFGMQIKLSPCAPTNPTANCDPNALVCVSMGSGLKIQNAGKQFVLIEQTDEDNPGEVQIKLKSLYGSTCEAHPSKNYTTYVSFGRKIQPRLIDASDCEFHIEMFDPNMELPCTKKVDGFLLDFRSLAGEMKIQSKDKTFFVNLCGPANSCRDSTASACVFSDNSVTIIGSLTTQKISFTEDKNVQITYQFGMGKRRLQTRIYLKCNWNVIKAKGRYVVPSTQGRNYQFIIESSLGCVKLPMNCQIHDLLYNYQYNLNGLHRPNSFWEVSNVGKGKIKINMCGPLKSLSGVCAANYSQVCHTDLRGRNFNYGSILTHVKVQDDIIRATFSEGSVCTQNRNLTLNTNIAFKCNSQEKGPILLDFKKCSVELLWETPKACPYYVVSSQKCSVIDMLGKRNVSGIYSNADRRHSLTSNSILRYNLCGNLIQKCGGFSNVSICLHVRNKQYVLGFTSTNLISSDGLLSLVMLGEKCSGKEFQRKVNVTFVCSHTAPKAGVVAVTVVHDRCIYNVVVTTPLACTSKNQLVIEDCSIINESSFYNLTLLSRSDKNYVIRAPGQNEEYSINVCRPTLTTSNALCIMNTGVCVKNTSEPNFKHRYYSVGARQKFVVQNNELQLHYTYGKFCAKSVDSSTIIHFKCSSNEEKLSFLRETNCVHEFTWITPQACPKKLHIPRSLIQECILKDDYGNSLNLTDVKKRRVELVINKNFIYLFNICEDRYTVVPTEGREESHRMERKVFKNGTSLYIEFVLKNKTCTETEELNSVQMYLTCASKLDGNITLKSFNNCVAVVELLEICKEEDSPVEPSAPKEYSTIPLPDRPSQTELLSKERYITVSSKIEQNCSILYDNLSVNMNTIKPISILSPKKYNYTVGLGNPFSNCAGYICKENRTIATLEECPRAEVKDVDLMVNFSGYGGYTVEIWFKCNATQNTSVIMEEAERHVALTYPLWEVCVLKNVKSESGLNLTEIIWIIVAALILLIASVIVAFLKKFGFCTEYRKISSNKSSVEIYCKNLSE